MKEIDRIHLILRFYCARMKTETVKTVQNLSYGHNIDPINMQLTNEKGEIRVLTEERHRIILEELNNRRSVTLGELCERLGASESTVRRDLNLLAERGMLFKVRGGAVPRNGKGSGTRRAGTGCQ